MAGCCGEVLVTAGQGRRPLREQVRECMAEWFEEEIEVGACLARLKPLLSAICCGPLAMLAAVSC